MLYISNADMKVYIIAESRQSLQSQKVFVHNTGFESLCSFLNCCHCFEKRLL